MRVLKAFVELYRRGIDCGLESFQGVGFTAWVVDSGNRRIERRFDLEQLNDIPEWLVSTAAAVNAADDGLSRAHDLLADLAASQRKNPKRVDVRSRQVRHEQQRRA